MSVHGSSITTVSPDKDRISRKDKKIKFQKFWSQGMIVLKNQTDKSRKAKVDSSIDEKKQ